MLPFSEKTIEIGMIVAGAVGLLVLIAPTFGVKPKATMEGWRFSVKPTCLLLYYLALAGGVAGVAFGAEHLLGSGTTNWVAWASFVFGFFLVPLILADWPEPLILDRQGLLGGTSASSRICWQDLRHVREYRSRYDRGVVIHGAGNKQMVIADITYDSEAVLDCLLQWRPVPYYSLKDEIGQLSILSDHRSRY
jgi:hypothetical protein